jgi:hypothetical protein
VFDGVMPLIAEIPTSSRFRRNRNLDVESSLGRSVPWLLTHAEISEMAQKARSKETPSIVGQR